jgi:hypothetical protein
MNKHTLQIKQSRQPHVPVLVLNQLAQLLNASRNPTALAAAAAVPDSPP